jgi:hypothetical protein
LLFLPHALHAILFLVFCPACHVSLSLGSYTFFALQEGWGQTISSPALMNLVSPLVCFPLSTSNNPRAHDLGCARTDHWRHPQPADLDLDLAVARAGGGCLPRRRKAGAPPRDIQRTEGASKAKTSSTSNWVKWVKGGEGGRGEQRPGGEEMQNAAGNR